MNTTGAWRSNDHWRGTMIRTLWGEIAFTGTPVALDYATTKSSLMQYTACDSFDASQAFGASRQSSCLSGGAKRRHSMDSRNALDQDPRVQQLDDEVAR